MDEIAVGRLGWKEQPTEAPTKPKPGKQDEKVNVADVTQRTLQGEQAWWYTSAESTGKVSTVAEGGIVELLADTEQCELSVRGFSTPRGANSPTDMFAPSLPLVLAAFRIAADPSSQHPQPKLTESTVREIVRDEVKRVLSSAHY